MDPRWTVYCHTHVESGRRYVGLTKLTTMRRWNQHLANARKKPGKGCQFFWNAIRKYGKDAFSHHVVMVLDSVELANAWEEFWIDFLDTRNSEHGFNLMRGGRHTPHPIRKNPWDNPEYRARQSEMLHRVTNTMQARANNKRALNTPESKAKRSVSSKEVMSRPDVLKKLSVAATGKTVSQATRVRVSEANRGRKPSDDTKRKLSSSVVAAFRSKFERTVNGQRHRLCSKCGLVPDTNCYVRVSLRTGNTTLVCKRCSRDRDARRKPRRTCPPIADRAGTNDMTIGMTA